MFLTTKNQKYGIELGSVGESYSKFTYLTIINYRESAPMSVK